MPLQVDTGGLWVKMGKLVWETQVARTTADYSVSL